MLRMANGEFPYQKQREDGRIAIPSVSKIKVLVSTPQQLALKVNQESLSGMSDTDMYEKTSLARNDIPYL